MAEQVSVSKQYRPKELDQTNTLTNIKQGAFLCKQHRHFMAWYCLQRKAPCLVFVEVFVHAKQIPGQAHEVLHLGASLVGITTCCCSRLYMLEGSTCEAPSAHPTFVPDGIADVGRRIHPNEEMTFTIDRKGESLEIPVKPAEAPDGTGRLGVQLAANAQVTRNISKDPLQAVQLAARQFGKLTTTVVGGRQLLLQHLL